VTGTSEMVGKQLRSCRSAEDGSRKKGNGGKKDGNRKTNRRKWRQGIKNFPDAIIRNVFIYPNPECLSTLYR
jgi:hypothetical protein